MKSHNYTPKVNCPACRRDGKLCPGLSLIQRCPKSEPQPAVKLIDTLRPPWEEK